MANSLLNYRSMLGRLMTRFGEAVNIDELKQAADNAYREILETNDWSFLQDALLSLDTVAPKTSNDVSVTNNSSTIGSSTITFDNTWLNGHILIGGSNYYITAVDTGSNELTVDGVYHGSTDANISYSWCKYVYTLDADVHRIISAVGPEWWLEEEAKFIIDRYDHDRSQRGQPIYYSYMGQDSSGDQLIELWPPPDSQYHINYTGIKREQLSAATQTIRDIMPALEHLASVEMARIAQAKAIMADRIDQVSAWRQLADQYAESYTYLIERIAERDSMRFGRSGGNVTGPNPLYGKTNIDFRHPWGGRY